jgi:hypothetical protein
VDGEATVKAGFLFNFAQFVEWPDATGPFTFCILGDPEIGQYLKTSLTGKSLGSRPVGVLTDVEETALATCNVIYLGRGQRKAAPGIAQALAGRPVLLVSEFPELGARGVPINFYLDEERIRFEIHMRAAVRCGLKISSRLLKLARINNG